MKNKTIIDLPNCLKWDTMDIDMRLNALGKNELIESMTDKQKSLLLKSFFIDYEDDICEFINLKLENYLENK